MSQFYFDEDVSLVIAAQLQGLGHQVVTVRGLKRTGVDDAAHLLEAAQQGRIFVTHNRKDFILLHRAWQGWSHAWGVQEQHAGILIVPQWPPARAVIELQQFMQRGPQLANTLHEMK